MTATNFQAQPRPIAGSFSSTMNSRIILVQDSDVQRRTQICRGLSRNGYQILEVVNPQHAESICQQRGGEIDLLILESLSNSGSQWRLCSRAQVLVLPALPAWSFTPVPRNPGLPEPSNIEQLLGEVQWMLGEATDSEAPRASEVTSDDHEKKSRSVKTLSDQETEAVCLGLDGLAKQIGLVASRLRNDPTCEALSAEALALERNITKFQAHLWQLIQRDCRKSSGKQF